MPTILNMTGHEWQVQNTAYGDEDIVSLESMYVLGDLEQFASAAERLYLEALDIAPDMVGQPVIILAPTGVNDSQIRQARTLIGSHNASAVLFLWKDKEG